MNFLDKVKVISIDIYNSNNVSPLVSIGDIGEFVGYQDNSKNVCMVKVDNAIRLLPIDHLKVI